MSENPLSQARRVESLRELSARVGVAHNILWRAQTERCNNLRLASALKIAAALGCRVEEIWELDAVGNVRLRGPKKAEGVA
jgi:DNA-binding Xre family transcriptional regulator